MTEAALQARILAWLRDQPETFAVKFAAGPFTMSGVPDILCCVRGRYLALEVKHGRGKATPIQLRRIEQINAAGGRALVVRTLEAAQQAWRDV